MAKMQVVTYRKNPDYVPGGQEPEMLTPDVTEVDVPDEQPNTPDNPYFGKKPKKVGDFWGLVFAVYVAMAPGATPAEKQANGADRYARLRQSSRAIAVADVIRGNEQIDPDDKEGDFLKFLAFLRSTPHETDGQPLMSEAEETAIMAAWK